MHDQQFVEDLLAVSLVLEGEGHVDLLPLMFVYEKVKGPLGCSLAHLEVFMQDSVHCSIVEMGCGGDVLFHLGPGNGEAPR